MLSLNDERTKVQPFMLSLNDERVKVSSFILSLNDNRSNTNFSQFSFYDPNKFILLFSL
jgi:hypothetical protein